MDAVSSVKYAVEGRDEFFPFFRIVSTTCVKLGELALGDTSGILFGTSCIAFVV